LDKICARAKRRHKEFDALIPYSGGKDGSFVLYVAKKELGLNCLAYTCDNGYLPDYAKNNIDKVCRKLGVEHVYYRFNSELMNRLYALFVRKTGYPCSACMRAIATGIYKLADMYDIPIVIQGTSLRTELPLSREMAEHGRLPHVGLFSRVSRSRQNVRGCWAIIACAEKWVTCFSDCREESIYSHMLGLISLIMWIGITTLFITR